MVSYQSITIVYQMDDSKKDECIVIKKLDNDYFYIFHNDKEMDDKAKVILDENACRERIRILLEMNTLRLTFSHIQYYIPGFPTSIEKCPVSKESSEILMKAVDATFKNWPEKVY
jgi:hypothetical protein